MKPAAAPLLFTHVGKRLAGRQILRDVSFECPRGSITALLGPNGAGKTTTVAVATGLRRPDDGSATIFGADVQHAAARRHVSLVPQEIAFPDPVTVARCLDFVARQRPDIGLAPRSRELCERLNIDGLLQRRAGGLSGGQRRKLAVAMGFICAPGVLVMDEATTNLDEATRSATWQLTREYVARGGAALVTSHILADIESHADRVVALNGGRVVLRGPLAEIRARLGGSSVSAVLPAADRCATVELVAELGLGVELPSPGRTVSWRTHTPLALVQAVAARAPDATDLLVRPIPLSDLLDTLSGTPSIDRSAGQVAP